MKVNTDEVKMVQVCDPFVYLRLIFLLSLFHRPVFGANLDVFLENFRCEFSIFL